MKQRMPVLFVSHGAPDALLKAPDTVNAWREIGRHIPKPQGILAVSAHWETSVPTVSLAVAPETIHDFAGFSPELYQLQYPAPGAPSLAERTATLLSAVGIPAARHPDRGLDHGAWVPLTVIFAEADIPVTQLSLTHQDAAAHFALGQILTPLRDEGILIVASGAITHNFAWLDWRAANPSPPRPEALSFANWVGERLVTQNIPALLNYRTAPYGKEAHPTEDHILPLFVAMGAAGNDLPEQHRPAFAYGGLAMDAYAWGLRKPTC